MAVPSYPNALMNLFTRFLTGRVDGEKGRWTRRSSLSPRDDRWTGIIVGLLRQDKHRPVKITELGVLYSTAGERRKHPLDAQLSLYGRSSERRRYLRT